MPIQPKKNPFKAQEIYHILREEIINLTLIPGTMIGEIEMTERFQISRTPIREVFKRLEIEGLIRVIPNKGTVVTAINVKEISKFVYIREKLEIGLVEDLLPHLTEEGLTILKLCLLKQDKLIKNTELPLTERALQFYDLDYEFHVAMFQFMNQTETLDMIIKMMPNFIRYDMICAQFNTEEELSELYEHHCEIMDALEEKDLPKLKSIYHEHVQYGVHSFRRLIAEKEDYFN
ncbi:MAG: GntR family transcriptional regulator [Eubacteriales bacterium]